MGEDSATPTAKWGKVADNGFTVLPLDLFKAQRFLGLTATEMLVLLNILTYWWRSERKPFPRTSTLAERMRLDIRTIQRAQNTFIQKGLLKKIRQKDDMGLTKNQKLKSHVAYDPAGLIQALIRFQNDDWENAPCNLHHTQKTGQT